MKIASGILALLIFGAGCASTGVEPQPKRHRPFYYYHTNYPEQMHGDQCHGCSTKRQREYESRQERRKDVRRKLGLR